MFSGLSKNAVLMTISIDDNLVVIGLMGELAPSGGAQINVRVTKQLLRRSTIGSSADMQCRHG